MARAGLVTAQLGESVTLPDPRLLTTLIANTCSYTTSNSGKQETEKHLGALNVKGHQGAGSVTFSGPGAGK